MKSSPVAITWRQYVQLFGLTSMTLLSGMCVLLLVGILLYGVVLVHYGLIGWLWMISGYLLLVATSIWWMPRFFRWLYLKKRLARIKKAKKKPLPQPAVDDDEEKSWKEVIHDFFFSADVFVVLFVAGVIAYVVCFPPRWWAFSFDFSSIKDWNWKLIALIAGAVLIIALLAWKRPKITGDTELNLITIVVVASFILLWVIGYRYAVAQVGKTTHGNKDTEVVNEIAPKMGKILSRFKQFPSGEWFDYEVGVEYRYIRGKDDIIDVWTEDPSVIITFEKIGHPEIGHKCRFTPDGKAHMYAMRDDDEFLVPWKFTVSKNVAMVVRVR